MSEKKKNCENCETSTRVIYQILLLRKKYSGGTFPDRIMYRIKIGKCDLYGITSQSLQSPGVNFSGGLGGGGKGWKLTSSNTEISRLRNSRTDLMLKHLINNIKKRVLFLFDVNS